jgi:hypothetical protein
MNKYDTYFEGGCSLTQKSQQYFEDTKFMKLQNISFEERSGNVYFVAREWQMHGVRWYPCRINRLVGKVRKERSAWRIQEEALVIMALNGRKDAAKALKMLGLLS